ncbi:MAG TPA: UPF0149 family protein [Steroidobacteraceae bacterium]
MSLRFNEVQQALAAEHSLTEAAEAHGTLAGALCSAVSYRFEDWVQEILPEGVSGSRSTETLRELYTSTAAALSGADMEFNLLLPDDEQPLDARTVALAQWCFGFLYGLGSSAIQDASRLPGDVGEIVRDLEQISRAGVDARDSDETNESAYAELVEFVRVGVQLVFEELGPLREQLRRDPKVSLH